MGVYAVGIQSGVEGLIDVLSRSRYLVQQFR